MTDAPKPAPTKTQVYVDWSTWWKFGYASDGNSWLLDIGPLKIDNTVAGS